MENTSSNTNPNVELVSASPTYITGRTPKINYGAEPSINIHSLDDNELNTLIKGIDASTELSFSLVLLSIAVSVFVTLNFVPTVEKQNSSFVIFMSIAYISTIIGLFLLLKWYRQKSNVNEVVQRIKGRISNNQ
jgi:NADH:ubiquinone oxidoreductase subunit K